MHLALAGTLTAVGVFVAALLPSQEVEATRSQVQLITPTITAEAVAPEPRTESSTSELVAKVDPDSEVAPASNTELDSAAAAPKIDEIKWSKFEVRSGDNLTKIFKRAGLTPRDVHQVSQSDKDKLLTRIRPGQFLELALNNEGGLDRLRLVKSKLESVIFVHNGDGYDLETVERTPELRTHFVSGDIQNSLYLGAQRAGLSDSKIMELAQIFGWDIDFALDIRKGDQFRVLYEEKYLDGEKIGEGNILAAEFTNNGDTFAAVRYTDSNGDTNYYTPDGRSMRKAFLRSPVDFRRISSGFKRERYHPVLGVKRPHRGTDYAAKTGTPIKASGDGKVIWRGTKGGYGKTIIIQHGGNITTLYAHMSKYNSKVTSGSRVKQGQTIGYVGMTGTATGPHLHYEFRLNGVHKNPVTVKLPDAQPIANKELAKFKADTSQLIAELQMKAVEQLADASLNSNNDG
ncbi:MAG: peptidoglycan DD-metalloendopeptidase family protein [Oceanospirillaceae bacterium]|nr:peptidoglycan DD-metalloendopeptidase family protein [Oceanospirillaceae bacterium]